MLKKELLIYYNSYAKLNSKVDINTFNNFITFFEKEAIQNRFINPFKFAREFKIDEDESIRIFTILTDDTTAPPLLKLRPYFQCITNNCYLPIFLDDTTLNIDEESKTFYCPECDNTYEFEFIKDDITFVYEIPQKYRDLLLMKGKNSPIQKIEAIAPETLKKFSPPSIIDFGRRAPISYEEKKGAITYQQLESSNIDSSGVPLSSPASNLTARFANKRANRKE